MQALTYLSNLEELYVSRNRLKKLTDLHRCKHLQELDLSRNQLTDLSGISDLVSVQVTNAHTRLHLCAHTYIYACTCTHIYAGILTHIPSIYIYGTQIYCSDSQLPSSPLHTQNERKKGEVKGNQSTRHFGAKPIPSLTFKGAKLFSYFFL